MFSTYFGYFLINIRLQKADFIGKFKFNSDFRFIVIISLYNSKLFIISKYYYQCKKTSRASSTKICTYINIIRLLLYLIPTSQLHVIRYDIYRACLCEFRTNYLMCVGSAFCLNQHCLFIYSILIICISKYNTSCLW